MSAATIREQAAMILGAEGRGLVELRAVHPRLRQTRQRWFGGDELDGLTRTAATLSQSYDTWLGAASRIRRGGTAADVAHGHCVWADCDTPLAVEALRAYRPRPTLVVRTSTIDGERLQAWWALARPLAADEIAPATARLAAALGSDTAVCDPARVLRAVGTMNRKRDRPEPVEAIFFTGEVHELDAVLAAAPARTRASTRARVLASGEPLEPGGRHKGLLAIAIDLVRRGVTDADLVAGALYGANRARCRPPLDDDEVASIARWAAGTKIAGRESRAGGPTDAAVAAFARRSWWTRDPQEVI